MDLVISAWDREWFHRCRRAWDFGSSSRRNLEPTTPAADVDLQRAIEDALAVYYYPAMWDWQPAIVRPLVLKGFRDAVVKQGVAHGGASALAATGEAMLEHYFEWAPVVDSFSPILVEAEYGADAVDPGTGRELLTAGGAAVRFRGRIQLLAQDADDAYWLVVHRVVAGEWDELGPSDVDDRVLATCWAWERFALMTVTGVIVNELRVDVPEPSQRVGANVSERRLHDFDRKRGSVPQNRHRVRLAAGEKPVARFHQEANPFFRRTQVPVTREQIAGVAACIGTDALAMTGSDVSVDPSPSVESCGRCPYLRPCTAMEAGAGVDDVVADGFRPRPARDDEIRLGGLFGLNIGQLRVREYGVAPRS